MTDFLSSLRPWIEDVACDALWGRQPQHQQQQQPVVRMGQVVDLLSQEDGGYVVVSDTRVRIPVIVVGSDNTAASSSSSSISSCFPIGSIVRLTRPYLTTLADVDDESEHNRWPLETDPNTLVFTVEKLEALHYGAVCGVLDSIFVMQSIKVRQVVQYIQQQHSSSSSLLLSLQEYLQKYRVEWGNVSDVVIDDEHNNNDDDLRVVEELFTRIVGEDDDDSSDNESEQDKDKDDGDDYGDSKAEPKHNNDDNELFNDGKTNNNNPLSFIVNAIARMGGVDSSTENRDEDLQKQQQEDDNDDDDDDSGKGGLVETQPQNRDDKEKEQESPKRNEDDDGDKGAGVETQPPYHDDDDIIIINNKNDENENARPASATRPQTRERRGKQLQRLSLQFERQQLEELSSSTSKHSSSRFPDDDDEDDDDDNEGMGVSNMLRSESPVSTHAPPARATVAEKSRRSSSKRVRPTAAATNNDSDESDDDDDARLETQAPWRAEDESSMTNKSSRKTAADPPTSITKKRKLPHDTHTFQQPQPPVQRTIDRWRSLMGSQQPNSSMDVNGNDQVKNDMDSMANRNPVQGIRQWLNR
jgi:hypothetical protein